MPKNLFKNISTIRLPRTSAVKEVYVHNTNVRLLKVVKAQHYKKKNTSGHTTSLTSRRYFCAEKEELGGGRFLDKDGNVYVVEKDPVTGKLVKKVIGKKTKQGNIKLKETAFMSKEQKEKFLAGKRNADSDSDYSYRSVHSAGGTRKVLRRRRRADGTYSDSEEYDSANDPDGEARRRRRRRAREHGPDSAHSYHSVVSEGGTRHVRRRRKREDGTYSDSESYHSPDTMDVDAKVPQKVKDAVKAGGAGADGQGAAGKKGKKGKGGAEGEDEDEDGAGGTGRKGKAGGKGGVGGSEGEGGGVDAKGRPLGKKKRKPGQEGDADSGAESDFSYKSHVSEGGTHYQVRQKRIRDSEGNVVGYGDAEPVPDTGRESVRMRRGSLSDVDSVTGEEIMKNKIKDLGNVPDINRTGERQRSKLGGAKSRDRTRADLTKEGGESGWPGSASMEGQNGTGKGQGQGGGLLGTRKGVGGQGKHGGPGGVDLEGMPGFNVAFDPGPPIFSDESSDEEDVDLSKMTEEEKQEYFKQKEQRRAERDKRRREKYGDKYDEMMKKHKERKAAIQRAREEKEREEREAEEEAVREGKGDKKGGSRRTSLANGQKEKPKSMVTYEKGPSREIGGKFDKTDERDVGLKHSEWGRKSKDSARTQKKKQTGRDFDDIKQFRMPIIPQGRVPDEEEDFIIVRDEDGDRRKKGGKILERKKDGTGGDADEEEESPFYVDEAGNIRVKKGKDIDLSKLSDEQLRELGIDPTLSKKEIAKLLKKKLGSDVIIREGTVIIGTKGIEEYDLDEVTDEMLANDMDLDVTTLTGMRRTNVLFRRGGAALLEHVRRLMEKSHLQDDYAKDLDERDGDIDFLSHYRLVNPLLLESYARAFAVEDSDLDTVINFKEARMALEGIPSVQNMTNKQREYVFKVLHIDDATQVTFRMFAVVTALVERVSCMDPLCRHLLEMCNLADVERKLGLYEAMFYHNTSSDRTSNFITAESLKIELIAGGLNWKQQQYIMNKMQPNDWGEISFLDYMTYIPLFMSMHDNICDNPLDMSDQKYVMPPRRRPPSVQRDMNPLGNPLRKTSTYLMKRQAKDIIEGKMDGSYMRKETLELLNRYSKLPDIPSLSARNPPVDEEGEECYEKLDLIY